MTRTVVRSVTMADVGAAAGVTARTVSNVLSGKVRVRPETRDAVLRSVRDLGYQLNTSARGLRTGRTGFVTLAIPDLSIEYFAELSKMIMQEAAAHDLAVIIQQTGGERQAEMEVVSGTSRLLSDGLLFSPHALGPHDGEVLAGGPPLVLLGDRIFDGPVDHVTMANADATAAATRHLLQRGRTRLASIGANPAGGPISTASLRQAGFERAHADHGVAVDPARIGVATRWHYGDGAAAMGRLLDSGVPVDGVVCYNDTLAIGALHVLGERGIAVPEQVAVVGFDNVPAAAYTNPGLTSIDPGRGEIARRAVELLARRIADGPTDRPERTVTDFSLVVRRSA